jgi:hypothetical protein
MNSANKWVRNLATETETPDNAQKSQSVLWLHAILDAPEWKRPEYWAQYDSWKERETAVSVISQYSWCNPLSRS